MSQSIPHSSMIQAIETIYAGYRFCSRLEARWAVFFDQLSIRWEYESQGYVINGRPYLPDFKLFLPDNRTIFAEVKQGDIDEHEGVHIDLCRGLAHAVSCPVLLLTGIPSYRMYHQFTSTLPVNEFMTVFFTDYGPILNDADDYWFNQVIVNQQTGALEFPHNERAACKSFGRGLVDAVKAARSARFEHGEIPATRQKYFS
jgi:hypothetical protein